MSLAMRVSRASYQGDPGLWGFIKGTARAGLALATGGPTAAGASIVRSIRGPAPIVPSVSRPMFGATTPQGYPPPTRAPMTVTAAPGIVAAGQRFFRGGATGLEVAMPAAAAMNGRSGGFHLNKSSYFLQSGEFVAAGTRWVKNRRRNPGNIKAASRALSRVTATKNALSSFSRVTIKCKRCGYGKCRCK